MERIIHKPSVTFAVDDVAPATTPLIECRTFEAVKRTLDSEIESCCDYHGEVVADVSYQPLLAAVYMAFKEHRPLVLTPDAVWITIAQGIAHHMALHGEQLRSRFVAHQGKLNLDHYNVDWVVGSPENPWPEAFASWADQIRNHVGPQLHDILVCDFSTTGPIERAASQIVMMDIFERYFEYREICICGIPRVTLEGNIADWQRLAEKAAALRIFDIDWWLDHLLAICGQFVRASRGDVDLKHWQGICKLRDDYGGDIINGWICKLFPYLREVAGGSCCRRNPVFETGEGMQSDAAPSGLSQTPFTWLNLRTGKQRQMEAIGGLVGIVQDPHTLALRPKVGWAVREAGKMDVLLSRLGREHVTCQSANDEQRTHAFAGMADSLPGDLAQFYHRTDGAELLGQGKNAACRIVPLCQIEPLDWGEGPAAITSRGPGDRTWFRFAELGDEHWLAINLDPNLHLILDGDLRERQLVDRPFSPICLCGTLTRGRPGRNPVVALSFTELLERMLASSGQPFWLDPSFQGYGDAERYTRRDA